MPLTDYKILLLNVNRTGWHSGNMIYDMEVFKNAANTTIYGPGWNNYKNTDIRRIIDQIYGDNRPDFIFTYFTPDETIGDVYKSHYNIPEHLWKFPQKLDVLHNDPSYANIKRCFVVSDFWARSPEKWIKDMRGSNFQYCFSCFTPPLSSENDFYNFINPKIMNNPIYIPLARCVDKECFKDYKQAKEQDIITVGSMCNFYPLRKFMHSSLKNYCRNSNIIYHNYPHCGTNWSHSGFVREAYAKAINKSKALASCGGKYHLYFNKIFESWGCNTAYIGEKPYGFNFLHMEDNVNYIAVTKNNFLDKVDYYMRNKDILSKISENGRKTYLQYHTLEARTKDLSEILKNIMGTL